ncbi:calcineurin-like phosphoesterase family protein [Mucilaginibacter gracilis]|uniref:alpha-L-rhamnosidase n=1 Tax=Mucilaginibacter gracilis TaxID=423350 RepID=A0A495ITJ9_9SPHI|nr:family 78 glycoside hydrolase catalytic domain [Mucilaginibacter gracilis]RKR79990.1 calcineurin-like phosphoesterase family protein [Mucilaginibacter gracilis]
MKASRIILSGCLLLIGCNLCCAQSILFTKAQWISPSYQEDTVSRPCPVFTKTWITIKQVKSAKLYITALGLYEATLNNTKVGNAYFTPGFTSYNKRLQYQTYDVTNLLKKGKSNISVTVADGWYRGVFGGNIKQNNYGKQAGLLLQLVVTFTDGTQQIISSDDSWSCGTGMTRYADFYGGEMQDTRLTHIINESPVKYLMPQKFSLVPTTTEPVTRHEVFKAKHILTNQVIDFGQNLAGFVRLKVKGKAGDTVKVYHAELLDSAGNLYTGNLRDAKAEDVYVLNGKEQVLEPHFTYHGFRYAKVIGIKINKDNCTAVALYSNIKPTGTFACSNPMINQLQHNILWSMKSNFMDIPTDCPQRSERLGWTGDAQVFSRTAALNANVLNFYSKYLQDLAADQGKNGGLPNIIPDVYTHTLEKKGGVAGWGDASTIIPMTMYEMYGDKNVLQRQYSSMKAWVDFIKKQSPDNLWEVNGYGDWYALGDSTSLHYIDQCFYIHSTENLIKAASLLHNDRDVKSYTALLKNIKGAYTKAYGHFDTKAIQTQTAYVLALAFDLLPEEQRPKVAALLAQKIKDNGNKLATGFLGTPYLLPVLSKFGYSDLAYQLLLQQECPSWLYPVTKGATTIWERWDAIRPDGSVQETSFNHFSYGAVGQWFYENIAGIQATSPGYKTIRISPEIGGNLTWAKATYKSQYGLIRSSWQLKGKQVILKVTIPKNTKAIVYVPGKDSIKVGPGSYKFNGSFTSSGDNDGPYVYYSGKSIWVKSVNNEKVTSDSLPITEKAKTTIKIHFNGHPLWDFNCRLKSILRNEPVQYAPVNKLFVVSDIEGEFEAFRGLLIANKIIDSKYNWIFGKGHLVICGDLFDRGKDVVPYLWLLYKLEQEAKSKGGYVHTILGNHDIMNLSGDFRYVDQKYFNTASKLNLTYSELFSAKTELGRWLRTKNIVEKIGDRLLLHGGISPQINALRMPLEKLNSSCRSFYDQPRKELPANVAPLFGKDGPFWYRGYFMEPRATSATIDSTLAFYGCKQIIVGHTILARNIASYYNGKVIGIDVNEHEGKRAGLLINNNQCYITDEQGHRKKLIYKKENDAIKPEDIL